MLYRKMMLMFSQLTALGKIWQPCAQYTHICSRRSSLTQQRQSVTHGLGHKVGWWADQEVQQGISIDLARPSWEQSILQHSTAQHRCGIAHNRWDSRQLQHMVPITLCLEDYIFNPDQWKALNQQQVEQQLHAAAQHMRHGYWPLVALAVALATAQCAREHLANANK
jgi:hypothetical protein